MRRKSVYRRSVRKMMLGVGISLCANHVAQAITATWITAASGNWNVGSNWSSNPNFPNNGFPNSGDTYDAVIAATGAVYTATLNSDITVNSLTLNSASATLNHNGGTLRALSGINLQSGSYVLGGGTIHATSLSGAGSLAVGQAGFLNGVTLGSNLAIGQLFNFSTLTINNGLTLSNSTLTLAPLNTASLLFNGAQSLSGNGTIVLSSANGTSARIVPSSGTLTVGAGITIKSGSGNGSRAIGRSGVAFINQGTIISGSSGALISVDGTNWSNSGTIIASNGATISLQGTMSGGLGTISTSTNGVIELGATVNNTALTSTLHGQLTLNGGTINGGTVNGSAGGQLILNGSGTLNAVTLGANLSANASVMSRELNLINGLTLSGSTLAFNGTYTILRFRGAQTLGGSGTITVDDPVSNRVDIEPIGGSLTIGSGITIRNVQNIGVEVQTLVNQGTIANATNATAVTVRGSSLVNTGTIVAQNGGIVFLSQLPANISTGSFTGGRYYVYAGSTINVSGSVTTSAADIRLDGLGSTFAAINSLTTNNGSLTIANGRTFNFAGPLTNNGAITAAAGGSIGINGGSNTGTIEAQTGGTIVFNGNFNHLAGSFLRGSGKVMFNGGVQEFFGTVVGDIELDLSGQANFRSGSNVSIKLLNVSTTDSSIETGATVNIGTGGLNFIGASSPAVTLGAGATAGKITLASDVSVSGNTTGVAQILNSGSGAQRGVLELSGSRTFTVNDGNASPDLLISANITNGQIIKSGPGTMQLTGSNTYGSAQISNGTLQVLGKNALAPGIVRFAGGTLDFRSDDAVTEVANFIQRVGNAAIQINLDRITSGIPGRVRVLTGPTSQVLSVLRVSGSGTLEFVTPLSVPMSGISVDNQANVEFSSGLLNVGSPLATGVTTGNGPNANGSVIFSGNGDNAYPGVTTVNRGWLVLNKTGIAIPADFALNAGTILLQQANQIADTSIGTITNNAVLNLGGLSDTIASLNVTGGQVTNGMLTVSNAVNISGTALKIDQLTNPGTVSVASSGTLVINGSYSNAGTIALNGGAVLYNTDFATTRAQIITGRAAGAWTGPGINSPAAAAVAIDGANIHKTAVGYARASDLGIGTFLNQSVSGSAVLMRYTLTGDANLDGLVTTADFTRLSTRFNQSGKFWSDGDFNFDGVVNALDFNAIASNFGFTLPGDLPVLGTVVPEPSTLAIVGVGWAFARRRR